MNEKNNYELKQGDEVEENNTDNRNIQQKYLKLNTLKKQISDIDSEINSRKENIKIKKNELREKQTKNDENPNLQMKNIHQGKEKNQIIKLFKSIKEWTKKSNSQLDLEEFNKIDEKRFSKIISELEINNNLSTQGDLTFLINFCHINEENNEKLKEEIDVLDNKCEVLECKLQEYSDNYKKFRNNNDNENNQILEGKILYV